MRVFIGRIFYYCEKIKKHFLNYYFQKRYVIECKSIGANVKFNGISKITGIDKMVIGENVHIGDNAFIRAEGGLEIGDNTHFSRNVVIYTHSHNYNSEYLPYDNSFTYKKVIIGKNVWIGINVTILPGTKIGDGAIIGAGAIVVGEVSPCSILGAAKGKEIKKRDRDHYNLLESKKKYGGVNGEKYEK